MHLFSKENIWSNPHVSCIHPDKYNNFCEQKLFPKKRREKIQGEILQSSSSTVVFSTYNPFYKKLQCFFTRNPASFQSSRAKKTILHTEFNSSTRILQEILQLQGSSHADHYKASSSNCSRVSKHSTRQNKAPSSPTASQAYTALAGFQLILPGRIALQAAASIHAAPTVTPRHIPTEFYQEK